jgi:hypothetical protein
MGCEGREGMNSIDAKQAAEAIARMVEGKDDT